MLRGTGERKTEILLKNEVMTGDSSGNGAVLCAFRGENDCLAILDTKDVKGYNFFS